MKRAMWVWNINKEDTERFVNFIKEKKIDKILINYDTLIPIIDDLDLTVLVGDSQNKLSVSKILNICKPYSRVHLDIELASGETREHYYKKLKDIITALKKDKVYIEIDVECWNKDLEYLKILNLCDEFALMNYSNSFFKQMWMSLFFRNKPYYMGIETNPELSCTTKNVEKRISQFNFWNSWDNNFLGIAVHCWGYWK